MTPYKSAYLFILLGLFLSGCASPAEVKNMVVNESSLVASTTDTPFKNTLMIANVDGGEETNPMWTSEVSNAGFREALRESMAQSLLLSPGSVGGRYALHAILEQLDQPLFGLDMTVTSTVRYRVVEQETQDVWFDNPVTASYTATFGDAPIALVRLRLANEGSIRENIKQFISRLLETQKPSG